MDTPTVSILIRTRNGGDRLRRVALAALDQQPEVLEVLLLDSGSTDGVPASLRDSRLRMTAYTEPFTHPGSSNAAAREARGEVLVFLSQDALPIGGECIARLVRAASAPGCAGAFARQVPVPGTPALEARDVARTYPASGRAGVVFSNVCSAIRRGLWERHPFDERLPLAEDLEWGLWARAEGMELRYEPEARVEHSHAYAPGSLRARFEAEGRALAQLGLAPFALASPDLAWLRGLPGDLASVIASGRFAEFPASLSYHRVQYRALARGAAEARAAGLEGSVRGGRA